MVGRDHFANLQLVLPLLDIWDWLAAALLCTVFLLILRLLSVRSPLVRFACRWLCSSCLLLALLLRLLLALLFCLLLALLLCLLLALLFSVLFIVAPDLRCSSRCPRTRLASPRSSHHWLVDFGFVSDSHHLLLGCGSFSDSLTTGSLTLVPSVHLLQSHCVVGHDSVARFWLPPTSLLSVAPFVIDGSR